MDLSLKCPAGAHGEMEKQPWQQTLNSDYFHRLHICRRCGTYQREEQTREAIHEQKLQDRLWNGISLEEIYYPDFSNVKQLVEESMGAKPKADEVIIQKLVYDKIIAKAAEFDDAKAEMISMRDSRDYWRKQYNERIAGDINTHHMESDIGKLRAYLGSKLFDDIVSGEVKAAPLTPSPWRNPVGNWRGPVR